MATGDLIYWQHSSTGGPGSFIPFTTPPSATVIPGGYNITFSPKVNVDVDDLLSGRDCLLKAIRDYKEDVKCALRGHKSKG
jgi:hypothetical protein